MYGYFYPENNQRFLQSMEFETVRAAIDWFQDKRPMWGPLQPQRVGDEMAFLNSLTGDIVVVRKLENMPTDNGIFWVETTNSSYYNAVAHVNGVFPFLRIVSIWYVEKDYVLKSPNQDQITRWGPKIEWPDYKKQEDTTP